MTGLLAGASLVLAALFLPATPLVQTPSIPGELVSFLFLLVLGPIAWVAWTARSPRRFAVGIVVAATVVFVAFYPNWSGMPLPNGIFNWYQGLLPTWLYPFQFAVNTDPAFTVSFASPWPLLLLAAVLVSAAIVAYSAWVWRIAIAERLADEAFEVADTEPAGAGGCRLSRRHATRRLIGAPGRQATGPPLGSGGTSAWKSRGNVPCAARRRITNP